MKREVKGSKVTVKLSAIRDTSNLNDLLNWVRRYVNDSKIMAGVAIQHLENLNVDIITVELENTDLSGTRNLRERLAALAAGYCMRFDMDVTVTHES